MSHADSPSAELASVRRRRAISAALVSSLLVGACQSGPQEPAAKPNAAPTPTPAPAKAKAAASAVAQRPWGFEKSDIPVNPRIAFGQLDNGMRFAWLANAEPKERAYLRLHIDVGSFAETEAEQGLAHFLEHMVFNGSRNYPAGTLVEWFQKHGMTFGGDTNAHTAFSETVYEIDLPKADEQSLKEGFSVLRDFADGALLEQKEIDAEKGVIDAEERERDNVQFRMLRKSLEVQYAGTLVPRRLPIGYKTQRDAFNPQLVRGFYEKWYRPDNMTLVVVGDLGERNPETMIREAFASMKVPATPLPKQPDLGKPAGVPTYSVTTEPEMPVALGRICLNRPFRERERVWKAAIAELPGAMARAMLNTRLGEMAKKKSAPFLQALALDQHASDKGNGFHIYDGEMMIVVSQPDQWEKAMDRVDRERRRAIDFGFDDEELVEVKANLLRRLDEAVQREKTKPSASFVNELLELVEQGDIPTTAEADRAAMKSAIQNCTVEMCHQAFREAWGQGDPMVMLSGNVTTDAAKLQSVMEESRSKEVKPRKKEERKPFAYSSSAEKAGKIAQRSHDAAADFESVTFENGVRLHVKKTDFQEKQVLFGIAIGEGDLTVDPATQSAIAFMADTVFMQGGLGQHTTDDLRRLMAGKEVGVSFGSREDAFSMGGSTTKEDLLLSLEVACAQLTDPGWRPDGIEQMSKQIPVMFDSFAHQHSGPVTLQFMPELYSGNPRQVFPKREALEAVTVDHVKSWLEPALKDAPIDVTVVGDLDVEATIAAVARTFGALGKRRALAPLDERRTPVTIQTGLRREYAIETEIPKTMVGVYFPTTDSRDRKTARLLNVLEDVVSDRLRVAIREKLGAAYSPRAGQQNSEVFPGDGMLLVSTMAEPAHVAELRDAILEVGEQLATKGATDDEIERAKLPRLASIRDRKRTNGYWMGYLSDAHRKPQSLEEERSLLSFYEKVTAAEVNALAKKYLPKERASVVIVAPKAAPAK